MGEKNIHHVHAAIFTLVRSDGMATELRFTEDEPGDILIRGSGLSSGHETPAADEHDRFDHNRRAHDAWQKRMLVWLQQKMQDFSGGHAVSAYRNSPHEVVAGYIPDLARSEHNAGA